MHLTPVLRARRAAVNKQANTGHTFAALCHRPLWFQGTSLASGDPVPVGSHRPPSGVLPKKPPVTQSHKARPAVSQGYFRNCPVTFTYHVHCLALETESLVQLEFVLLERAPSSSSSPVVSHFLLAAGQWTRPPV